MYCKGLTKEELQSVGIFDIKFYNDDWHIFRYWYNNNTKTKAIKEIAVTKAVGKHKYRPNKIYPKVTFSTPAKKYNIPLSRLIYVWFVADIPDGYVVDHIDNNSWNCFPSNLQILTIADNLAKRFEDNPDSWTNQWGKQKGYNK